MEVVTDYKSLKMRIEFLEKNRIYQKEKIAEDAHNFVQSLKPANLIRSFLHSMQGPSELRSDILHAVIGLGTGFVTNKLLLSSFHGPLKKIIATLLQAGITNAAVKYPEKIKAKGISLMMDVLQGMKFKSS